MVACSGKCAGGACGVAPRVWVLAACEGGMLLFERKLGGLELLLQGDGTVFTSVGECCQYLGEAAQSGQFNQLVLVGGASDMLWAQALLPPVVARYIVAEIHYPLMSVWFRQQPDFQQLSQALKQLFVH